MVPVYWHMSALPRGAARGDTRSCSLHAIPASSTPPLDSCLAILPYISSAAVILAAPYLTVGGAGCSRWAVYWILLMPVYDPRAREQFRQAALGRPAARGRRASYDSSTLTKTISNKLLSPASASTAFLPLPSLSRSQPSSPQPPPRPTDGSERSPRRSSLAPATWLNSNPQNMYEKLPQDSDSKSPTKTQDVEKGTGASAGATCKLPELRVEGAEGPSGGEEFEGLRFPERRSLPDIGLPPGQSDQFQYLAPKPLLSPPAIPTVPEHEDEEEEEEEEEETSLTDSLLNEIRSSAPPDYALAAQLEQLSLR